MYGMNRQRTYQAGGNINPAVFLKVNTTRGQVVQAGAGEIAPFISARGSKDAQIQATSSTLVAVSGDPVMPYTVGMTTLLTAGSGGFSPGDKLKPDASGFGITTVTANDQFSAIALDSAASGEMGEVLIFNGKV